MDPRYAHPMVSDVHSKRWTYGTWLDLEALVVEHQVDLDLIPESEGRELLAFLGTVKINERAIREIEAVEIRVQHDVVAFLTWLRTYPKAPASVRWLHHGLTSSDIVDTTMGFRFRCLHKTLLDEIEPMFAQLAEWSKRSDPIVARTHGQLAEPTSIGFRATGWVALLEPALKGLLEANRHMQVAKMSGPVGTYAHNPPELELLVAAAAGLAPAGFGMTQIVPRSRLAMWANAASVFAACCSKIAMDTRLMNITGEASEGKNDGEIGSSSMAHKRNPIIAEQIGGLARLAQGYASMLQPLDLWLERDISHSSVERVAVPDLWHVLLRTIRQTTRLLSGLQLIDPMIEATFDSNSPWTAKIYLEEIQGGMGHDEARVMALENQYESYAPREDARWFVRHFEGHCNEGK